MAAIPYGPFGLFVLWRILFGDSAPGPSPGPAPSPVFPVVPPSTLPPWPQGWCPDDPPPPEVVSRAWALLPTLWAQGEGSKVTENTSGRWITYVAERHIDGLEGVTAYRAVNCQPVPPVPVPPGPAPGPAPPEPGPVVPPPVVPPGPEPSHTPAQTTALAMNVALGTHGYKLADQALYRAFQKAVGITADGFPGTGTMGKLSATLATLGLSLAPVKVYPWKSMPGTSGYNGVNAPTWQEWTGQAAPVPGPTPIAPVPPSPGPLPAPPIPSPPNVTPNVSTVLQQTAVAMRNALDMNGYRKSDQPIYKAFQKAAGTTQDGYPGTGTMGKLKAALDSIPQPMPNVAIYPWHSKPGTTGYDGVNAPSWAQWNQ